MKKIILFIVSCYSLISTYGQAGMLDVSFGTKGIVQTDLNPNVDNESAYRIARQSDGKLEELFTSRNMPWIARYYSNGEPDQSIRSYNNAYINFQNYYGFKAADLAAQKDGKILVAGSTLGYTLPDEKWDFALIRFTSDGYSDDQFGHSFSGYLSTPITPGDTDSATALALQPDGKIIVVGTTYTGSQYN